MSDKAQMIGKRYCDVCPDDFGRIPTEQNAQVIKRIHGISPMQLITKTRITAGCRMLHESDASVAEIALECGFFDHSAFTGAFHAVTGMPPHSIGG